MTDAQEKDLTIKMLYDTATWPKRNLDGQRMIHLKKRRGGGLMPTTAVVVEGSTDLYIFDEDNPTLPPTPTKYMTLKDMVLDGWVID